MIGLTDNNTRGDFKIISGKIATDLTFHTIIYLSLFGGNLASNTPAQRRPAGVINDDWWGNVGEITADKIPFNSNFERSLIENSLISGNLRIIEQAANNDLEWMKTKKIIESVESSASITGVDKLKMEITIKKPEGIEEKFEYFWDNTLESLS